MNDVNLIPHLLAQRPLESLELIYGDADEFILTMENVRLALENLLQDYQYDYIVSIEGSNFIIEPSAYNSRVL